MNDPKQLLGIKGASETSSIWKLRIQLMKPITWIPLIWGVICGAAASGNFEWTFSNVLASLACMLMSGPLLAGYTQTINDFFDKEIDAINEPNRPIPSGKISIKDVKIQIWVLLIAGLIVAFLLDLYAKHTFPSVLLLALGGSFVSYIYSAPPLKLKQNGWLGNYALGASYIALPWWAGQALFGKLTIVTAILTLAYSLSGLGIAVINDFKSVEGDSKLGLNSLPVVFGIKNVKIQIWVLLIAGLIVAFLLDLYAKHSFPSVLLLALGGSFVSYIYSAPPLKLKQNGWLGNYALGASYIALPWWAGQALFGKLTIVTAILTLAYSLSGLGIAVINDFKSVEGDSKLGLNSLPVVFGIKNASRISAGLIDIFQLAMVVVLVIIGQHLASVILVLLVIPQITFQDMWLLRDPLKFDVKYQASAQPFLITGMLVTALAIGHSFLVA